MSEREDAPTRRALPRPTGAGDAAGSPAPPKPAPRASGTVAALLREQLKRLVKAAEMDSDPAAYAVFITDQVPERIVRSLVEPPTYMDTLKKLEPRAAEFAPWFDELRRIALEILNDQGEEEDGPKPEAPAAAPPTKPGDPAAP